MPADKIDHYNAANSLFWCSKTKQYVSPPELTHLQMEDEEHNETENNYSDLSLKIMIIMVDKAKREYDELTGNFVITFKERDKSIPARKDIGTREWYKLQRGRCYLPGFEKLAQMWWDKETQTLWDPKELRIKSVQLIRDAIWADPQMLRDITLGFYRPLWNKLKKKKFKCFEFKWLALLRTDRWYDPEDGVIGECDPQSFDDEDDESEDQEPPSIKSGYEVSFADHQDDSSTIASSHNAVDIYNMAQKSAADRTERRSWRCKERQDISNNKCQQLKQVLEEEQKKKFALAEEEKQKKDQIVEEEIKKKKEIVEEEIKKKKEIVESTTEKVVTFIRDEAAEYNDALNKDDEFDVEEGKQEWKATNEFLNSIGDGNDDDAKFAPRRLLASGEENEDPNLDTPEKKTPAKPKSKSTGRRKKPITGKKKSSPFAHRIVQFESPGHDDPPPTTPAVKNARKAPPKSAPAKAKAGGNKKADGSKSVPPKTRRAKLVKGSNTGVEALAQNFETPKKETTEETTLPRRSGRRRG